MSCTRALYLMAVSSLLGLSTACSTVSTAPTPTPAPTTHTINGRMLLHHGPIQIGAYGTSTEPVNHRDDGTCSGGGTYSDLQAGASVVVRDSAEKVVGLSSLGTGHSVSTYSRADCAFLLTVSGIPASDFYSIEVGHRGEVRYSLHDIEGQDWNVDLSIGR
jgi:hypothetical protein